MQNYRGFKFNWTGMPSEEPAVVALEHAESTIVYVSWNGDTETRVWRFYGVDRKGRGSGWRVVNQSPPDAGLLLEDSRGSP